MTAPVQAHCLVVTSAAAFFALVDRHVTGPMEAAGYVKIGEYDEVTASARALPLIAAPTADELERRLRVLGEAMRRPGPDGQAQGGA